MDNCPIILLQNIVQHIIIHAAFRILNCISTVEQIRALGQKINIKREYEYEVTLSNLKASPASIASQPPVDSRGEEAFSAQSWLVWGGGIHSPQLTQVGSMYSQPPVDSSREEAFSAPS